MKNSQEKLSPKGENHILYIEKADYTAVFRLRKRGEKIWDASEVSVAAEVAGGLSFCFCSYAAAVMASALTAAAAAAMASAATDVPAVEAADADAGAGAEFGLWT